MMPRPQLSTIDTPADMADGLHYLELRNHLAARISAGELKPGDRLPSERQLQAMSRIARGTIREGLSQLEAEGLIYRQDRSGWYVSPSPIVYDPTRWEGFISYVEAQGRRPSTETLDAAEITADTYLAGVFDRPLGAPLYLIRRRRHVDGRAVLVEYIVVDAALAPDLLRFSFDQSLTSILKAEYGLSVTRNKIEMQPCALTGREAEALKLRSGLPGLNVVRTSYDALGRVVEFDLEYWRHDAVKISIEVRVR
jgi:DNA-binding GntR family transcriptional regulator